MPIPPFFSAQLTLQSPNQESAASPLPQPSGRTATSLPGTSRQHRGSCHHHDASPAPQRHPVAQTLGQIWGCAQAHGETFSASDMPLVSPRSPPQRLQRLAEVTPVVIISVSPVVSVAAVLVIGSLSGQVVGPVAPRTVAVHVSPVPVVMVLIPVLLVLMVPVTAPRRVVVAAAVAELPLPLPVPSICGKRRSALMAEGHRHSSLHGKADTRYKQTLRPPLGLSAAG